MYSSEIDGTMREKSHNLDSGTYLHICATSPQICRVKFEPYENMFHIWTNDGWSWQFHVYPLT